MDSLFTSDNKIKVVKSPFSAYENEGAKYDGQTRNVRLEEVISRVQRNQIKAYDYLILEAVSELEFATSRMVTQYLLLRNVEDITQEKVHRRLKFLKDCKVVGRYLFFNEESETNLRIYCLEKHGKTLLLGRNYPCKWKPTDSIRVGDMKSILARNQVLMSFREKAKNLASYEVNPSVKLVKSASTFNPHLLITLDVQGKKEEIFFESVRSYQGYRDSAVERLKKYEEYYNYFTAKADKMEPPKFIVIGEDDTHLFEIFKLILKANINFKDMGIIYTHDLRVLDSEINKSFIRFDMKSENGKTKAKLTELNYAAIQL